MYTNELLEEKYKSQRNLSKQADSSMESYIKNIHAKAEDLKTKYNLKLKYVSKEEKILV